MDRGEREIWNKLSDEAKLLANVLSDYIEAGRAALNDLRLDPKLHKMNSREMLGTMHELQSRSLGHLKNEGEANPVFVINAPFLKTLVQTNRIPYQTPLNIKRGE